MDKTGHHSADIAIVMTVDGLSASVSHLGPEFVILRQPLAASPHATAILSMTIDGVIDQWTVTLPDGIPIGATRIRIDPGANP